MDVETDPAVSTPRAGAAGRAGTATLVLGLLMVASTLAATVLSVEGVDEVVLGDLDPPNWVRALLLLGLPLGLLGTPVAYAVARTGPGRDRARVGLGLMLLGLAGFVALQVALG